MIFSGVVNLFIYCRAKKLYLISKIKERELGKHVFQDFLKNNHLQGKKQVSLTYNDHQLWTKHERERETRNQFIATCVYIYAISVSLRLIGISHQPMRRSKYISPLPLEKLLPLYN